LIPVAGFLSHVESVSAAQPPSGAKHESVPGMFICTQTPADDVNRDPDKVTWLQADDDLRFGSRIVAFDPADRDGGVSPVNLTAGFAAAGRPDLSFDAKRILFVARRQPADLLGVWEMNVDGSDPRQVTSCPGDCDEAVYLSTIYTLDADAPVYQIVFRSDVPGSKIKALYTCRLDGSRTRRITFTPHDAFDPCILSDGRLLFSLGSLPKASPDGAVTDGTTSLFTVHTDGTDVFPFAAVHEDPAFRGMPCEMPDGEVVYVESRNGSGDRGGSLVAVPRTRSLRSRRLIADDSDGLYRSPAPLPDGNLLVSYKAKRARSYDLYTLDAQTGARTAKVVETAEWNELDAVIVAPRREPAGRSSVVVDTVDVGLLYCMNAYLSDTAEGTTIEPGRIKRLRVVRALSGAELKHDSASGTDNSSGESTQDLGKESVLGEVPVEPDGSFFLEVPARTPLRLETLDHEGNVLQRMKSWMWVMPKEPRGCIGCHEDRELTPPNRHVLALRKIPRKLKNANGATDTGDLETYPPKGLEP